MKEKFNKVIVQLLIVIIIPFIGKVILLKIPDERLVLWIEKVYTFQILTILVVCLVFISIVLVLAYNLYIKIKNPEIMKLENEIEALNREIIELKSPENPEVAKFSVGELVATKSSVLSGDIMRVTVYEKTKSKIICRDRNNKLIKYSPEELHTALDTENKVKKEEAEMDALFRSMDSW